MCEIGESTLIISNMKAVKLVKLCEIKNFKFAAFKFGPRRRRQNGGGAMRKHALLRWKAARPLAARMVHNIMTGEPIVLLQTTQ